MSASAALPLLRKIKLSVSRALNSDYIGQYRSAFRGNGLLFDSVREYQFGDEVKSIDWKVSARMNHLYVKEYSEERELNIVIALDVSSSMNFGTNRTKREVMLELTALFVALAQYNNDRISILLFTDSVEWYFTPQKGRKFMLKVLNDIMTFKPKRQKTDISAALDFIKKVVRKRSIIVLISDFMSNNYIEKLKPLRRRHDFIPVDISDPTEKSLRFFGLTAFYDLETGENFFSGLPAARDDSIPGFDVMRISTGTPVEKSVLTYFKMRNRKRSHA